MLSVGTIKYKNGSTWTDILHSVGTFHISNQSTSPASFLQLLYLVSHRINPRELW